MSNLVGTLSQQLQAVDQYLAIPQRIRDELGADRVWEAVMRGVLAGRQPVLPDEPLREAVVAMRALQKRLMRKEFEPEGRSRLIEKLREYENLIDQYLKDQP